MGEANKAYVRQDYDEAIRLCTHVITQYPYAPEPYTTLAMVHADRGDLKAALEFRKFEAVCLPKTGVDWETLGRMSIEVGNMTEAIHFFTEAFKHGNPTTAAYVLPCCRLAVFLVAHCTHAYSCAHDAWPMVLTYVCVQLWAQHIHTHTHQVRARQAVSTAGQSQTFNRVLRNRA